jgi:hypothetical protein
MKLLTAILILLLSSTLWAGDTSGNGGGNGGDALRKLFEDARPMAVEQVTGLKWCSFNRNVPQDLVQFILKNQDAIASDIKASEYRWVVDSQPTCGNTDLQPNSPLYLSYPTCASTVGTNIQSAQYVILHETAHHFAISNENQADAVASAIMNADTTLECPSDNDVFSPNYCSGPAFSKTDAQKFLQPGQVFVVVPSNTKAYGKYRDCTKLSGCTDWKAANLATQYGYQIEANAEVQLVSDDDEPGFVWRVVHTMANDSTVFDTANVKPSMAEQRITSYASYRYSLFAGAVGSSSIPLATIADVTAFHGRFNSHCVWLHNAWTTLPDANGFYRDAEVVISGSF